MTTRLDTQLRPKDLELIPDPDVAAREYTPIEIVGAEAWAAMADDQKRQLAYELDEWVSGMYRTRALHNKAIERGEYADLTPVRRLIDEWGAALAERITEARMHKKQGPKPLWLKHCSGMSSHSLAAVAIETVLSVLLNAPSTGRAASVADVSRTLGRDLDVARRMAEWMKREPALYRSYRTRLAEAGSTRKHRRKVMLHGINNKLIPALLEKGEADDFEPWDKMQSAKIGQGVLLMVLASVGGRILLGHRVRGPNDPLTTFKKPTNVLSLDEETHAWIREGLRKGEIESRRPRPMVCKPLPWHGPIGGGYLLGTLSSRHVIQRTWGAAKRTRDMLRENPDSPQPVYQALNYLGSVPMRIRRSLLDVAVEARDAGIVLDGLPVMGELRSLPVVPDDIATNEEARRAYRQARARAEEANLKIASKALANEDALAEAELYRDEPVLYFPHACDFRGRMYPMPSGVHAQGSDLRRALIEFAEGKPISSQNASAGWLAIQVAKTFGQDKLSLDERITWVFDNEETIRAIADDPLGNRALWESSADDRKLWQCLASCMEWRDYLDHGDGFVSHLPVFVDGTCNGIQHFAAMSQCPDLAELVNLTPGAKPADVYHSVAARALYRVKQAAEANDDKTARYARMWLKALDGYPARKLAKTLVMVHPYGGTMKTALGDVRKTMRKIDPRNAVFRDEDEHPKLAGFMAKHLRRSLLEQLARPERVLAWVRECVDVVHKHGFTGRNVKPGVGWVTPTGWTWGLMYGAEKTLGIKTNSEDATMLWAKYAEQSSRKVDIKRQKSAACPNFVHALDATALVFALNILERETDVDGVIAIHDSVGALAADMPLVDHAVRLGFVKLYTEHRPLMSFYEAILDQVRPDMRRFVPPPPELGDFDVRQVINSTYFFS